MRKMFIILLVLTACNVRNTVPFEEEGKMSVHLKLVELPNKIGDTLKCLVYSLTNGSDYDYYLSYWPYQSSYKLHYAWTDTSLYDKKWLGNSLFTLISEPYNEQSSVLHAYLQNLKRSCNVYFMDSAKRVKVEQLLKQRHISQIFRYNPSLTKIQRERIARLVMAYPDVMPIFIKAGETVVVGVSDVTMYRNIYDAYRFPNYPESNDEIFITYHSTPSNKFIKKDSLWIYADDPSEPFMLNPYDTSSYKEPEKIRYYDPEPYSKYRSYYPYMGDFVCRDTIVIESDYLLQ